MEPPKPPSARFSAAAAPCRANCQRASRGGILRASGWAGARAPRSSRASYADVASRLRRAFRCRFPSARLALNSATGAADPVREDAMGQETES